MGVETLRLPLPDRRSLRLYQERARADAPVRLGVVSNPFSRTNSRTRLNDRLLPRFLPDRGCAIDTRTRGDLDRALRVLLFDRGVNVLGLNGGDGTLHLGVNRLAALAAQVRAETGEDLPLPRLLFLNGGTLNIVSRACGTKGNPVRTVRHFTRHIGDRTLGEVPVRELKLLQVEEDVGVRRYGFVFGTEIVANALEMYGMFGEGYTGLARFLVELVLGYGLSTRLWQEHGWKLDPPTAPCAVDAVHFPRYLAAVAATIDLSILKGLITAFRVPRGADGFFVKLLTETDKARIILLIPRLLFAMRHPAVHDMPTAERLQTVGGYTLDGEVFLDRSPRGLRRKITVSQAPFQVSAVAPRIDRR